MRTCFIEGCGQPHEAKNLCVKHYQEFYYAINKRKRLKQKQGEELAKLIGITNAEGIKLIGTIWQVVIDSLKRNDAVCISGLGTFYVKDGVVEFRVSKKIEAILNQEIECTSPVQTP